MHTHDTSNITRTIHRFQNNAWSTLEDTVVAEKAMTISINGSDYATIVCSPWDLKDITIGYLCSEGRLKHFEDLKTVSIDEENGYAYFEIEGYESNTSDHMKRYVNASCGKNRSAFYYANDALLCQKNTADITLSPETILTLSSRLEEQADLFKQTGGVHCAAISDQQNLWIFAEDIGRHNTLDRLYGYCFQKQIPLHDKIVVFSGRIASEILLKTAKMGCPVLLSRSAPTNLALKLAEDLGITVIGFARGNRFNIYTHPERVNMTE